MRVAALRLPLLTPFSRSSPTCRWPVNTPTVSRPCGRPEFRKLWGHTADQLDRGGGTDLLRQQPLVSVEAQVHLILRDGPHRKRYPFRGGAEDRGEGGLDRPAQVRSSAVVVPTEMSYAPP
jgi:hypothetical protein